MAAQDYASVVQQLYVSYFGRPADYFGLQNFESQLNALNAPTTVAALNAAAQAAPTSALGQLINSFSASTEATNLYGTDTSQIGTSKFIEQIYLHVLNREPDADGWTFWVNAIQSGSLTRANAALAITQGASANTSTQGLLDAATVANKLTVATNFTADLTGNVAAINGYSGDAAAATARGMLATVDSTTNTTAFQATVDSTVATITAGPSVNTALTTGVDTIVGTAANDVFTGTMTANTANAADTLNSLDSIDGGAGNNTLNVLVLDDGSADPFTGLPAGVSLTNIQNLSIRSAVAIDVTAALTESNVAVTQATAVNALKVGSATAVSVSGVTAGGGITVDGGTNETITANGNAVTLGHTTGATGAISVAATNVAANDIAIDGGSTVSVTASGIAAGTITIGAVTHATGVVVVNATGAAAAGAAATLGQIEVHGGTSATVVETATSDATAAATDTTADVDVITEGNVVIAGTKTTTVAVQQTATVAGVAYEAAVAGAKTVDVVTFTKMAAGDVITVDGLTFTAGEALTAAQVASAFASLTGAVDQGSAAASLGTYTGAASGNFVSGTVGGTSTAATVTFTSAKADGTATVVTGHDVGNTVAVADPAVSETTAGAAANDLTAGVLAVTAGEVTITSTDNKIATVSLDGYSTASISSDGLTSLSLADSDSGVVVNNGVATTLALTLNNIGSLVGATLNLGATYTTLNIATAGADSVEDITAGSVTALTIAGTNAVDLTDSTFTNLKTVTVTGAAGVTIDASGANVTAVDTSATTGNSTVTIDATNATFTGGAGVEKVTVTGAITKAIALGAGNDTLILSDATAPTATVDGGDGTDTITFTTGALAATATSSSAFESKVTGFEKLGVTTFGADATVDLHNMHDINYVVVGGGTAGTLTFSDMGANGTVELDGADSGTAVAVTLADATGTSDVLNVVLKHSDKTADTDFGVVKATGVETINLTATDTNTKVSAHSHVVDVLDAAVKAIVVTGNANVTLTADAADVALASVDATALTGTFTASTNGTVAETIKGGAAGNTLTALGTSDVLVGGAGSDTLIVQGNLDTLTGGGGADTFNVSHATTNVNSYATITDLVAGDTIVFAAATSFAASKVVLGDTAVFQDYANAAIAASGATNALSWFQIGGNTYIVENESGTTHTTFTNGTDVIVKITGAVDLSHSSLSATNHDLIVH